MAMLNDSHPSTYCILHPHYHLLMLNDEHPSKAATQDENDTRDPITFIPPPSLSHSLFSLQLEDIKE